MLSIGDAWHWIQVGFCIAIGVSAYSLVAASAKDLAVADVSRSTALVVVLAVLCFVIYFSVTTR